MEGNFNFSQMQSNRKLKRKRQTIRKVVNIVAIIVLVCSILLTGYGALDWKVLSYQNAPNLEQDIVGSVQQEGVTYILVAGECPPEEHATLTDTIIVACIDHTNKTLNFLQFPRDLFIGNESGSTYSGGKINATYAKGRTNGKHDKYKGISELARVINNHFGVPIDHYVLFDIKTFIKLIDGVGGLELTIQQQTGVTIKDYDSKEFITVGPGKVNLKGSLAVGYMRKRTGVSEGYIAGDADRVKAQQLVYISLAKKLKTMNVSQMSTIANNCYFNPDTGEGFKTNLKIKEILSLALEVKDMKLENMGVYAVPGQYSNYNGSSVYSVHKERYLTILNDHFLPGAPKKTEDDIYAFEWHTYLGQPFDGSDTIGGGTLAQLAEDRNQN